MKQLNTIILLVVGLLSVHCFADRLVEAIYVNIIDWQANPAATDVIGYYIYRNGVQIATVNASTFEYVDHNVKRGALPVYAVSSFNQDGLVSLPVNSSVQ